MINEVKFVNNPKLETVVKKINEHCNYKRNWYDNFSFKRPTDGKGYFEYLKQMILLGEFSWENVVLHHNGRNIDMVHNYRRYCASTSNWCKTLGRTFKMPSFRTYIQRADTTYHSFFHRHGLMEKVAGKPGVYRVTPLALELFEALNIQMVNNMKL